jgi:molecular chaperone DnaK
MVAPTPVPTVRLHLKCSDTEDFVERFAPNVTRGGIFLPTREPRDVGATIRFEL